MIRASIVGATGYVGLELVRLLSTHPEVELSGLVSQSFEGQDIASVYPSLRGVVRHPLEALDVEALAAKSDVLFTSLPHGASDEVIPALHATGKVVIDMSGDFRYDDASVYETWYKTTHKHPELLRQSVYGLPEWHRDEIRGARLIGNPGCYTTCSILALAPLLAAGLIDDRHIVIDAKSGSTGAGRNPSQALHFCEVDESFKAYNVATHRHTSEIEQELSRAAGRDVLVSFTPHLLPSKRGILATCYADLRAGVDAAAIAAAYAERYDGEPFVVVRAPGELPEVKHVNGSNFCHIGFVVDERLRRVVVVSCIDNLIKGAAGQAIQNMNIAFGYAENAGLAGPAWYL